MTPQFTVPWHTMANQVCERDLPPKKSLYFNNSLVRMAFWKVASTSTWAIVAINHGSEYHLSHFRFQFRTRSYWLNTKIIKTRAAILSSFSNSKLIKFPYFYFQSFLAVEQWNTNRVTKKCERTINTSPVWRESFTCYSVFHCGGH